VISYADLVTILLACFAATYATAPVSSVAQARALPPPMAVAPAIAPKMSLRDRVAPVVAANASQRIAFAEGSSTRDVVIALPETASFATGSAVLTAPAQQFLRDLATSLRDVDVQVRIEGHTDTVPVTGGRYASNWELSTARASAVVGFLIDQASFTPDRLSASGYAEFHPRVENDSAEHRAVNRRVDVVLIEPSSH
jgi:flagellar motor protein MotB